MATEDPVFPKLVEINQRAHIRPPLCTNGTVDDIQREVDYCRQLFPEGGLILGPTHTIEPDTPLENILEMYRAAGSLRR